MKGSRIIGTEVDGEWLKPFPYRVSNQEDREKKNKKVRKTSALPGVKKNGVRVQQLRRSSGEESTPHKRPKRRSIGAPLRLKQAEKGKGHNGTMIGRRKKNACTLYRDSSMKNQGYAENTRPEHKKQKKKQRDESEKYRPRGA